MHNNPVKRVIICEAGATKADWRVIEDGMEVFRLQTEGTNVSTMSFESICSIIREAAEKMPCKTCSRIHFYTAGVVTPQISTRLEELLKECFKASETEIQTDLTATARAACGHEPGIAVIMGTGSNSCLWDGVKVVSRVLSGGFILGDEGSAASLGRVFISDYIKGLVPEEIASAYAESFPSGYSEIISLVYGRESSPSGWLGSLCPFILSHYAHPYIKNIVDSNFMNFADRCLSQYDTSTYPVSIIGGFGNSLKDIIRPIFEQRGIRIRAFIPSPIENLIDYHIK